MSSPLVPTREPARDTDLPEPEHERQEKREPPGAECVAQQVHHADERGNRYRHDDLVPLDVVQA